jgi:hypothetical protein
VTYAQPYYNPSVMCGTIMLKPDIQSIPVFKWQEAAADSLYTMLMIDPTATSTDRGPRTSSAPRRAMSRRCDTAPGATFRVRSYERV